MKRSNLSYLTNEEIINDDNSLTNSNKIKKILKSDFYDLQKIERKSLGYLSALTLPLILAACGGGGGGGAVSPTPDAGSGSSSSGGSSSGGSSSGSTATTGINANAGNYTATAEADTYLYDVTFGSNGSVTSADDGNVFISDFDVANDSIVLRGTGAPASFSSGGNSNVDVVSDINGNTVITLGSQNDFTYSITLNGVSDYSSVSITTADEEADEGSPKVDLSSGTVEASSDGEVFEYSVKFANGVPVASDGDVTINNFDIATDRIVIKTESLPSGYGKSNLTETVGVDVTTGIDSTRIDFGSDASGTSGSITLAGVSDSTLNTINLTFEIVAPTAVGSQVDIDSDTVAATSDAETFVYDASWDGDEVVGADGNVTITGFSLANDKLIILGSGIPNGYDRSQFEANTSGTQQIVVNAIDNKTVIYFAPDSEGSSTTLTLDGVVDEDGLLNIVFGSAIGELVAAPASTDTSSSDTTATDTSSTDTSSTDDTTSTDTSSTDDTTSTDTSSTDDTTSTDTSSTDDTTSTDTSSTDDSSSSDSYTVVTINETAEATVTATSAAEDFRYEIDSSGVSQEGAFTVTIDGFDTASDKLTLVIVGGTDNLTTQEFDALTGVEVTSDGLSGTQIFFAPDSSGQSGGLTLSGVEESFDDTWTATTYTVEILADTNVTG